MSHPPTEPNDTPRRRRITARHQAQGRPDPRLMIGAAAAAAMLLAGTLVGVTVLPNGGRPATVESIAPPPPPELTGTPSPASTEPLPAAPTVFYQQAGPPAGSPLEAVEPMSVSVSDEQTGTVLPTGLVGISLEATDLANPQLSGDNAEIVTSLQGLGQPMLRFGGNAVDRRFFWTSSGEPIPAGLEGDKAHPVRAAGPADLERINTLLVAADATISLTVDLAHFDPARAADMAKHASNIFGDRLVGITVGNEPNGYPKTGLRPDDWWIEDYLAELKQYAEAMYAVAPDVAIVGPGTYSESWWEPFAQAEIPQEKILSFHHYPLSQCDGAQDPLGEPIMENLMAEPIHERAQDYRLQAMAPANAAGLNTWIPETGISACPGSNETTETHASALWTVDYALSAAELGIPRLSFHSSLITCQGGPPMSSICTGGQYLQPDGTFHERANWYGQSLVAELPTGWFLESSQQGGGLAYSYAVKHEDGSMSVILVNQNNPQSAAPTDVTITLPEGARTGVMTQMTGPSYRAHNDTRIDGQPAPPIPAPERPSIPDFEPGTTEVTLPITAGTATVFTFTF
ncbi:hypothetical protein BJ994_001636 [Arthrobacter pigmenti]|uniref:Uncharacterized protein n=1 Tax=Arthrobacter pigmenti TaxID=271432 RepID=A0A846RLP9_9MICC|nr:hypothetical protein [Arthrobacter pigmenti]NJC22560.1 hypothetical protein [Arthrobacter pigmenti]